MKNFGILLIAIDAWGSGFYYQLAYNMALSLKLSYEGIQIAVLTDDKNLKALSNKQKEVFTHIIEVSDDEWLENYKPNPFKLKTKIYKYSPFAETLYLDADGLFLHPQKKIEDLYNELTKSDFQIHEVARYPIERAHQSGMIWTQPKEKEANSFPKLWELYGISDDAEMPETNSSFIFWKKNEANEAYFTMVEHNYNDRRLPFKDIGTSYPDEMAWNISSAQLKHYSAVPNYKPCYLEWDNTTKDLEYISSNYWFMMLASGYQPNKLMTFYDNLVKMHRTTFGDTYSFKFEMLKKIFFRK